MHVYEYLDLLAPLSRNYLAIGVQEGECVRHVVEANPAIDLVLCDTWGPHHGGTDRGSHEHIVRMLAKTQRRGRVSFLDGDSAVQIPKLHDDVPLPQFDLINVDGDHSTRAALADLTNCWPLLAREGVLLLHDINMPEVAEALRRFREQVTDLQFLREDPHGTGTALLSRVPFPDCLPVLK